MLLKAGLTAARQFLQAFRTEGGLKIDDEHYAHGLRHLAAAWGTREPFAARWLGR